MSRFNVGDRIVFNRNYCWKQEMCGHLYPIEGYLGTIVERSSPSISRIALDIVPSDDCPIQFINGGTARIKDHYEFGCDNDYIELAEKDIVFDVDASILSALL